MKTYPLLQSQMGIFLEWIANPEMKQGTLPYIIPVSKSIDSERMSRAVDQLVAARPEMKMRFVMEAEGVRQYIDENMQISLSIKKKSETEAKDYLDNFIKPFDLLSGEPLWRFEIMETEERKYFLVNVHHIISDGTTMGKNLFHELSVLYAGGSIEPPTKTILDYAEEEAEQIGGEAYEKAKAYYAAKYQGVSLMTLNPDCTNPWGKMLRSSIYMPMSDVDEWSKAHGTKSNRLFIAAFSYVMSVLSGEDKVAYATVRHGRHGDEMLGAYGMFVKTIPVFADTNRSQKVIDFICGFRDEMVSGITNEAYPFTHFCQDLGQRPGVMFTFQGPNVQYAWTLDGERYNFQRRQHDMTASDITAYIYMDNGSYEVRIEASEGMHTEEYVKMVNKALHTTVLNMMQNPDATLGEISVITEEEEKHLVEMGQGGTLDFDRSETLVDLFRKQAAKTPDNIAIVFREKRMTFREVDELTDRLAVKLHEMGIGIEDTVGVMIDRSELMLVYPMAIMKAGAAYMPLDFHFPEDRLTFMCEDASVRLILADDGLVQQALSGFDGILFQQSDLATLPTVSSAEVAALPKAMPQNMFVILYTSGSTGKPKGCMLEHHSIVNYCHWYVKACDITATDSVAAYANFGFDAHMMDIYPTISVGACVHIIPSDMRMDIMAMNRYFEENNITIAFMTTQIGYLFATTIENKSLRLLTTGGEKLQPLKKPRFRFYNLYGPTECTLCATYYDIDCDYDTSYIGRPLDGYGLYVVDKHLQIVPQGVPGELIITGDGVGRGYLNRPDMNAEKFITFRGEKAYRTGDLVRWSPDGNIDFLRRIDNQVKLRGLRIELGEIEARASQHEAVKSVCVDVKEISGTQNLVCYYVVSEERRVKSEELKNWLSETLTDFMVPEIYVEMDALPLTPNGKVNRRALPIPEVGAGAAEIVAPETETEKLLWEQVVEILKNDSFGVTTNLISVGMTSLLAMRLIAQMQQKYGWNVKMKDLLSSPTIRQSAAMIDASEGKTATETSRTVYPHQDSYPLTENQRGVYIDWEMHRDGLQYNVPMYKMFSNTTADELLDAVTKVVNAHPYLKTRLAMENGEVVLLRHDEEEPIINVSELTIEPDETFFNERVRPFDLFNDSLYRLEIYQSPTAVYLFSDIHHIVFDGGSESVLATDIVRALRGELVEKETYTAFDNALHEKALREAPAYVESEKYFDSLLDKFAVASYPHSNQPDSAIAKNHRVELTLPGKDITAFCRQLGITPNNFFMGVTTQTLHRLLREEHLLIASITNGREDAEMQNIMGMFVQTLPVVSHISKAPISELFKQMQEQYINTQDNSIVPYTSLVQKYGARAEILYLYQGGVLGDDAMTILASSLDTVKMPITIAATTKGDDYLLYIKYDSSLYSREDMTQLLDMLKNFATHCIQPQYTTVSQIPLLDADEAQRVLAMSQGKQMDYDESLTFVDLFLQQVAERPDAIAVADRDNALTYAELSHRSDIIAHLLIDNGVAPDSFVCLLLDRTVNFPTAVLGCHKAAAAYTPLDTDYPIERISYMLTDSESQVLLTTHDVYAEKCKEATLECKTIIFLDDVDFGKAAEPVKLTTPDNLAYMIYTSGSTGKPKGVMLHHRGLMNFIVSLVDVLQLTADDIVAAHRAFSFDAHTGDIYPVLSVGGQMQIMPSEIRKDPVAMHDFIVDRRVTGCGFTTSVMMMLMNTYPDLPVRFITAGGEKLSNVYSDKTVIVNLYGPTECTNDSTTFRIEPGTRIDNIPIGYPMANMHCFILSPDGNLLPQGIAGELCIAGPQVGRGYWHLPEKTEEVFGDCPFLPGMRMYHTGDLARYNADGQIEYLGRIDHQVKLRGFRIELGEIEAQAMAVDGIKQAVALVCEVNGAKHLVLYYTVSEELRVKNEEPKVGESQFNSLGNEGNEHMNSSLFTLHSSLKEHLEASSLAEYMRPEIYMKLDVMPTLPNGKINRKAMPPITHHPSSTTEFVPPANDTERLICDIFADILKTDKVGATDSFFLIGGTSLAAMRIIVEMNKAGHSIVYKDVFDHPTPRALAQFVSGEEVKEIVQDSIVMDYDYTAINALLQNNTLDNFRNGERQRLGNVLLTGATGYLGIHILRELLMMQGADRPEKIYCLVRGKREQTPEKRLKALLFYYFEHSFAEEFANRIVMVDGDVTQPEIFATLEGERIDTVINCAAVVKHFSQGTEIEDVNVGGVNNLIDFCLHREALLIHVSTVSVAGMSVDGIPAPTTQITEQMLWFGQSVENQYAHSKFLAERNILENIVNNGLNAKIMRVGTLSARDSDGEYQINFNTNSFMGRLKIYSMLGVSPYEMLDTQVEFSPIDETAKSILLLATTPKECCLFHPTNSHKQPMADIFAEMTKLGLPVRAVEKDEFDKALEEAKADPVKAQQLTGMLAYVQTGRVVVTLRANNAFTLQVLHRLGYRWPNTSWDYISRFLEAIKGLGFFRMN